MKVSKGQCKGNKPKNDGNMQTHAPPRQEQVISKYTLDKYREV